MSRQARFRRLPVGAEVDPDGGVHFRVWAPDCTRVEVIAGRTSEALSPEDDGYFSGRVPSAETGTRYRYRLDGRGPFPDPASRFQPDGPHGPSEVVDASAFAWSDSAWRGVELAGQVLYEMHVGTFTPEGTWASAARELSSLAELGVTTLELMPVSEFPGRFGWGYDGVNLFAPTRLYGKPDDFRRFVDRAHALSLGVLLDVVYNHFGPDGNYAREYSASYFSTRYENEWGEALNFDGERSAPVRELFIANAGYWIDEFHLDGLRLDATQQMFDSSPVNVMREMTQRVRDVARARATLVMAENEPQDVSFVHTPVEGGFGMDALWNDDFHHAAVVAATGHNDAYYSDYRGTPQELVSAVRHGFLFQGQRFSWQKKRRGSPTRGIDPMRFVNYVENHDQVANSATGKRLHQLTSPGHYRALTALLLLAPGTPMLFQGQEFASSRPFLYFADHRGELAHAVRKGRAQFLSQFPGVASMLDRLDDPAAEATFQACKLDPAERDNNLEARALHADLLRLRRAHAPFRAQRGVDGAVLATEALVLRYEAGGEHCLLLVNLGLELSMHATPEPLLAPPRARHWQLAWSSEDPRYGGRGTPAIEDDDGWHLPGHSAVVLVAGEA